MKKFTHIIAALAVCTCMLLTACGNESSTGNNSNNNNNNNISNENNAGANNSADDNNTDDDSSSDNSSADVEYVHSTIDDNGKFTSKFMGIGADFDPEEWIAFDDDYLSDYNGGAVTADELKSRLESGNMVYEMMVGKETGSNINVVIQKMGGDSISEEEYIDYNLEVIEDQLESTGTMEDPHASKKTVTFAGASRFALDVEGSSSGFELYERIIAIQKGDYMCMITITALSESEKDEFTSMFYGA